MFSVIPPPLCFRWHFLFLAAEQSCVLGLGRMGRSLDQESDIGERDGDPEEVSRVRVLSPVGVNEVPPGLFGGNDQRGL